MTKPRAKFKERRDAGRLIKTLRHLQAGAPRTREEIERFIERLRDINEKRGEANEMQDLEMMAL